MINIHGKNSQLFCILSMWQNKSLMVSHHPLGDSHYNDWQGCFVSSSNGSSSKIQSCRWFLPRGKPCSWRKPAANCRRASKDPFEADLVRHGGLAPPGTKDQLREAPLQRTLTAIIISYLIVKINKKMSEREKLLVQYHGRLLMSWCIIVLANERTLAAEGVCGIEAAV